MLLVTGANGYLGGWIGSDLRADSHGRLLDGRPIEDVAQHVTAIVHCGWFSKAGDGASELQKQSLEATIRLCELFRGRPVRFVFASTASVYDGQCQSDDPRCEYTRAKLAAELIVATYFRHNALSIRLASLMGLGAVRTKRDVCVNAFAIDGWTRKQIDVWNPDAWKPILHVRDAAELLERRARDKCSGMEKACWVSMPARDIASVVARLTGAEVREVADESGYRSCTMPPTHGFARTLEDAVYELRGVEGEKTDALMYGAERRAAALRAMPLAR